MVSAHRLPFVAMIALLDSPPMAGGSLDDKDDDRDDDTHAQLHFEKMTHSELDRRDSRRRTERFAERRLIDTKKSQRYIR